MAERISISRNNEGKVTEVIFDDKDKQTTRRYAARPNSFLTELVTSDGNPVTDLYNDFEILSYSSPYGEQQLLLGHPSEGSTSANILSPSEDPSQPFLTSDTFHEIKYREDLEALTGTYGATTAIIDTYGRRRSNGYHAIEKENGAYYGRLGGVRKAVHFK